MIDSEPLWQEAEKLVFSSVGINMTTEMCMETMGMRTDEVIAHRFNQQSWTGKSQEEIANEIEDEMERLIKLHGKRMTGVDYILNYFQEKNMRLALATSSCVKIINAVIEKLRLENIFEVIHSGEFEEYGKPDPAIYTSTLQKLCLSADEAFAIEDSYNGLLSAKAAKLKTIAIPEKSVWHESKYDIADLKLSSLFDFKEEHLRILEGA